MLQLLRYILQSYCCHSKFLPISVRVSPFSFQYKLRGPMVWVTSRAAIGKYIYTCCLISYLRFNSSKIFCDAGSFSSVSYIFQLRLPPQSYRLIIIAVTYLKTYLSDSNLSFCRKKQSPKIKASNNCPC